MLGGMFQIGKMQTPIILKRAWPLLLENYSNPPKPAKGKTKWTLILSPRLGLQSFTFPTQTYP